MRRIFYIEDFFREIKPQNLTMNDFDFLSFDAGGHIKLEKLDNDKLYDLIDRLSLSTHITRIKDNENS